MLERDGHKYAVGDGVGTLEIPWEWMTLRMTELFDTWVVLADALGWPLPDPLFWLKQDLPKRFYYFEDGTCVRDDVERWRRSVEWVDCGRRPIQRVP